MCGPMSTTSLGGSKYFMCLTDGHSKFRRTYFLSSKQQAADDIANYLQWFKTQTGKQVRALRSDGGSEFVNERTQQMFQTNGIEQQTSNPYTPQQNGIAERTNRTLVEAARTMLLASKLPKFLWAEAVNCATHLLNIAGTSNVADKTPLQVMFNKSARFDNLHVFGETCF